MTYDQLLDLSGADVFLMFGWLWLIIFGLAVKFIASIVFRK
jgi:hypothetical protein